MRYPKKTTALVLLLAALATGGLFSTSPAFADERRTGIAANGEGPGTDGGKALETGCVKVSGLGKELMGFVLTPAELPGPGDTDYNLEKFQDGIVGFGYKDAGTTEAVADWWGTDAQLSAGLKVWKETVTSDGDEVDLTFSYQLLAVGGIVKTTCKPPSPPVCVKVSSLPQGEIDFALVPADVPGPGDQGYDKEVFQSKVTGFGSVFGEEIHTNFFGTEAMLTGAGLKVYRIVLDQTVLEQPGTFSEALSFTLLPNAKVEKVPCTYKDGHPQVIDGGVKTTDASGEASRGKREKTPPGTVGTLADTGIRKDIP